MFSRHPSSKVNYFFTLLSNNIVRKCNATSLYTFFVRNQPEKGVKDQLENLLKISPGLNIYISGKERILKNINVPKNITVISDINSLIEIVTQ